MKNKFYLESVIFLFMALAGSHASFGQKIEYSPKGSGRKLQVLDKDTPTGRVDKYVHAATKTLTIESDNPTDRRYKVFVLKKQADGSYSSIAVAVVKRNTCQKIVLTIEEDVEIYLTHRFRRGFFYHDYTSITYLADANPACAGNKSRPVPKTRKGISGNNGGANSSTTAVEEN